VTRDWRLAREKVALEGNRCRVCPCRWRVEAAHVIGREHDKSPPLRGFEVWRVGEVVPDRIVPLCGPATDSATCHGKHHAHRLELLPHLTLPEQLQAVADAGGIHAALGRLIDKSPEELARFRANFAP
jgi:hypothetical protein